MRIFVHAAFAALLLSLGACTHVPLQYPPGVTTADVPKNPSAINLTVELYGDSYLKQKAHGPKEKDGAVIAAVEQAIAKAFAEKGIDVRTAANRSQADDVLELKLALYYETGGFYVLWSKPHHMTATGRMYRGDKLLYHISCAAGSGAFWDIETVAEKCGRELAEKLREPFQSRGGPHRASSLFCGFLVFPFSAADILDMSPFTDFYTFFIHISGT